MRRPSRSKALQARPVLVRGEAERHHLAAGDRAERRQLGIGPARPLARDRLAQRGVGFVQVDRIQSRHLVVDVVGEKAFGDGHGTLRSAPLEAAPRFWDTLRPRLE